MAVRTLRLAALMLTQGFFGLTACKPQAVDEATPAAAISVRSLVATNAAAIATPAPYVMSPVGAKTVTEVSHGPKNPLVYYDAKLKKAMTFQVQAVYPGLEPYSDKTQWGFQTFVSPDNGGSWSQVGSLPLFGDGQTNGSTRAAAFGDGSLLMIDQAAASKTGLPLGLILFSTTAHNWVPLNVHAYDQACAVRTSAACTAASTGTWNYRIEVFGSMDQGKTWAYLAAPGSSQAPTVHGLGVANPDTNGLWSNRLFERSDGGIILYFDSEAIARVAGDVPSQYTAFVWLEGGTINVDSSNKVSSGSVVHWTAPAVARGKEPTTPAKVATRRGMASVSEQCRLKSTGAVGGVFDNNVTTTCTMIMTEEDVDFSQSYAFGVTRISQSTTGGGDINQWQTISTIWYPAPSGAPFPNYNFFAPVHVRNPTTGQLVLSVRSDLAQATNAKYDPSKAPGNADPTYMDGQIYTYISSDGRAWTFLGQGSSTCVSDPGLAVQGGSNYYLQNYVQYGFYDAKGNWVSPPANQCSWAAACASATAATCTTVNQGCQLQGQTCVALPAAARFSMDYLQILPKS